MEHVCCDNLPQLRMQVFVRELCTDQVNVCGVVGLVLIGKHQKDVGMRQAPLLELDHDDY
jgi:hypothetical protein